MNTKSLSTNDVPASRPMITRQQSGHSKPKKPLNGSLLDCAAGSMKAQEPIPPLCLYKVTEHDDKERYRRLSNCIIDNSSSTTNTTISTLYYPQDQVLQPQKEANTNSASDDQLSNRVSPEPSSTSVSDPLLETFPCTTPLQIRERIQKRLRKHPRNHLRWASRSFKRERIKCELQSAIQMQLCCEGCNTYVRGNYDELSDHLRECYGCGSDEDVPDNMWICDVCKVQAFCSFDSAEKHEKVCTGERYDYLEKSDHTLNQKKDASNNMTTNQLYVSNRARCEFVDPSSVDMNRWLRSLPNSITDRLSAHNAAMCQSIEFFEVSKEDIEYNRYPNSTNVRPHQIGLRCISCHNAGRKNARAAYCFPGSIRSIASGVATISRRHYLSDKCSTINLDRLNELKASKAHSKAETAIKGKYGLETLCRDLSSEHGIIEHNAGLVFKTRIESASQEQTQLPHHFPNYSPEVLDAAFPFQPSYGHFWECSLCKSIPFQWRSSGSVLFSIGVAPPRARTEWHVAVCNAGKLPTSTNGGLSLTNLEPRLPLPSFNEIDSDQITQAQEEIMVQKVSSEDVVHSRRQSTTSLGEDSSTFVLSNSQLDMLIPNASSLVFEEDKKMVPGFVYYTMLQLLPCKLSSKMAGGSRSEMPPGFPGLSCRFCCSNEDSPSSSKSGRRFFYSSSFKLWNSFGSIANHILECPACPTRIRSILEVLKEERGRTRARGSQKKFMDLVWNRLHEKAAEKSTLSLHTLEKSESKNAKSISNINNDSRKESTFGKRKEPPQSPSLLTKKKAKTIVSNKKHEKSTKTKPSADGQGTGDRISKSDDIVSCKSAPNDQASKDRSQVCCDSAHDTSKMLLVRTEDKTFATDFVYLSMQQMLPCRLDSSDTGRKNLFPIGFGGLQCKYCAPFPNSRKFFYRTVEVLAGNFAQIPNHLYVCKYIDDEVKVKLDEAKKNHQNQKNKFQHGSQREFLNRIWRRIHAP